MAQVTKTKYTANAKHTTWGFWWADLATTDIAGAKKFYGELFGWDYEDVPMESDNVYILNTLSDLNVSAISTMNPDELKMGIPPHWNTYLTVDDVNAVTARVEMLGGKVLAEPFDVMDVGRMSVIMDPTGATLCLWDAGSRNPGAALVNVHGGLVWNELNTNDVPVATKFYTELTDGGWDIAPTDSAEMPYTQIKYAGGDHWAGGMMELPEQARQMGSPSHWLVYFQADDVDAFAKTATSLGGKVFVEPFDIPGVGRMSVLSDPQGAVFAVINMES